MKTDCSSYLDEVASFFGLIERKLFVDLYIKKVNINECKRSYLAKFKISSRQYNSILFVLDGKVKSIIQKRKYDIELLKDKLKSIEYTISKLINTKATLFNKLKSITQLDIIFKEINKKYHNTKFKLHQKKRKLASLNLRLNKLITDENKNKIRFCFGTKNLFHKQYNLERNNYQSLNEWKKAWIKARNSLFYCMGSKDESSGNQTCTYISSKQELRLRVAEHFTNKYGKYIFFKEISFPYGQAEINKALETYISKTKSNQKIKYCNSAISYRFIRKDKGWYVYASINIDTPNLKITNAYGCLGIDLNVNFVSLCEVDRYGNPIKEKHLRMNYTNRRRNQIEATMSDVVKEIVDYSLLTNKAISIEQLDFRRKKTELGEKSKRYGRMLSSFTYKQFSEMLKSRAMKYGVSVIEVNPAFTSIIGQIKYMKRYGLSAHGSAACVIARRGMGFKVEKLKYKNPLGDFSGLIKYDKLSKRWTYLTKIIKTKYSFQKRITLLLAS